MFGRPVLPPGPVGNVPGMADDAAHDTGVPDAALRKALVFALKVGAGFGRAPSPVTVPTALRPYLRAARLTPTGLRTVRAALDADTGFRAEVARRATADHVDDIGRLWLSRPDGWEARVAELLAEQEARAAEAVATVAVSTAEGRRREVAERKAEQLRAELDEARRTIDEAVARLDDLVAEREVLLDRVRALTRQLAEERAANENRRSRSSAAQERSAAESEVLERLRAQVREAEAVRDRALAGWADDRDPLDLDALRSLLANAARLVTPAASGRVARAPMPVPGGLLGDDAAVAEQFLRTPGVQVLVDGYNVAKQVWPGLELRQQRDRLVELCERLARRFGTHLTVVFDGAQVTGAHVRTQRFVKVLYTVPGELADDRLRSLVRNLDPEVKVVVVSSDGEVQRTVKAMGANVLANHVLADVDRR